MIRPQAQETGQNVEDPISDNQQPVSPIIDDPVDPGTSEGNSSDDNPADLGTDPVDQSGEDVTKERTYVVKSGDMLMVIAKKFYGDESKYKLIMDANGIKDPNKIAVGQELIIPPDE
jgi:nucleoid-associated protein YgaU